MNPLIKPPPILYGIGITDENDDENNPDFQMFLNSSTPKKPVEMNDKINKMLEYVEIMSVKNRDNNAILHQMMQSMEERINKRIDNVRNEILEKINAQDDGHHHGKLSSSNTTTSTIHNHNNNSKQQHDANNKYILVNVTPYPGFVVKTRRLLDNVNKVFINIFHHDLIDLESPGVGGIGDKDLQKPYLFMDQPTEVTDKHGNTCKTFNVGISSEYFIQPNPKVDIIITAPKTIYQIIHKINIQFKELLDEGNYSIPRLVNGFKGDQLPIFKIPILKSRQTEIDRKKYTYITMDNINQHHSNTSGGVVHQRRSDGAMRKIFNDVDDHNTGILNSDRRNSDQGSVTSELSRDNDTHSLRGSEYKKRNSIFSVFNSNSKNDNNDSIDTVGQGKKTVHIPRKSIFGSTSSNNDVYNNNSSSSSINHGTNDSGHYYNGGMIVGRNMLSGDMLEVRPDGNLNKIEIDSLKEESKVDPTVLLGWQIELEDEDKSTVSSAVKHCTRVVYVITDVRKNFLSQTEYRLSRYKEEDRWVKLCRSKERSIIDENKGKQFFNPLRKVLFNLQAVDEESIA